jgi:hypothetical protein
VTGKVLQKSVIDLARRLGWRVAHFAPLSTTRDGKTWWLTPVAADGKGWPDLVIVRDRVLYVEIKGKGDRLKPEQETWISALRMAGQEVHVWTPDHWTTGAVTEVLNERRVA